MIAEQKDRDELVDDYVKGHENRRYDDGGSVLGDDSFTSKVLRRNYQVAEVLVDHHTNDAISSNL
jgi:DNA-directed RNA polymerase alpha subunit